MSDHVTDLAFQFADETARSDIECMCLSVREDGRRPETPEQMRECWYDVVNLPSFADLPHIERAIEYLTLRGMLQRHPINLSWVRVLVQPTITPEISNG